MEHEGEIMMLWVLNPVGIGIVLISLFISFILFRKLTSRKERILAIGTMTQNICLLVAFVTSIYFIGNLDDLNKFGSGLALSIYLVIIGTVVKIVCELIGRLKVTN